MFGEGSRLALCTSAYHLAGRPQLIQAIANPHIHINKR
jgi:hypothetical protein